MSFVKDERVVTLRGEAYFEVARDVESPFIVQTRGLYTKVLGTSFNVKAYDDEPEVSTTLLSGKVEVCLPGDVGDSLAYATLSPGMQARVYANPMRLRLGKLWQKMRSLGGKVNLFLRMRKCPLFCTCWQDVRGELYSRGKV